MTNRERIILVLMAVAVLYGIYSLFFSSPEKAKVRKQEKSVEEINKFVAEVAVNLKDDSSEKHRYILTKAKNQWPEDPFLEYKAPVETDIEIKDVEKDIMPEETFTYTGYLMMGDRKIAIIDGLEYELGDELGRGGHIVKEISPIKAVIGPLDENNNITLLLVETK